MNHIKSDLIHNLCVRAEQLYNVYQGVVTSTLSSNEIDSALLFVSDEYDKCLKEIKRHGIHGVRINGVFRDLYDRNEHDEYVNEAPWGESHSAF